MAVLLNVCSVQAQSWQAHVPANGEYYLYNVGAGCFLSSGNDWGSRASLISHRAMPLRFTKTGNGYTLSSESIYDGRYLGDNGYIDHGTSSVWMFEAVSGQSLTYRMKSGSYLSWDGNGTTTTSMGYDTNSNKSYWKLVSKADLLSDLVNASTVNPKDASFLLRNSWMARGDGIYADAGWSGTELTAYFGNLRNFVVEQYHKTFDTYQQIDVPNGEYVLSAQGFYRTGTDGFDGIPYLYANNVQEPLVPIASDGNGSLPNDISTAADLLDNETGHAYYQVSGLTVKVVDGKLTIGVKSLDSKVDWCAFDNFALECTGLYFSAFAEPLPNNHQTALAANQWYYYDLPSSGTYALSGDLTDVVYTTNGAQRVGDVSVYSAKPQLAISANRVYLMSRQVGTTLSLSKVGDSVSNTFSVCALNVDGLPQKILTFSVNETGPGADGTQLISSYLASKGYDVIAVSEDFNYHGTLMSNIEGTYNAGTWRGALDAGSIAGGIFGGNFRVDTDGLDLIWKKEHTATDERWTSWNTTYGNLDHGFDANVDKGFRYYKLTLSDGTVVDVYIMHMDAETDAGDIAAREVQLKQLAEEVIANTTGRPKSVMGDTNCRYTRDQLKTLFVDAVNQRSTLTVKDAWVEFYRGGNYPTYYNDGSNAHDLTDSSQGTNSPNYEVVDKIFFVNPPSGRQLKLMNVYLEEDYVNDSGTELGDHAPLVAVFTTEGEQQLPTAAEGFWVGEPMNSSGAPYYLYNVGSQMFLHENGSMVASIGNASLWRLWGEGNERTFSTDNNYRLVLGYRLQSFSYYCKTQTSDGATTFTLESGWSQGDAFKLKASNHYVNVERDDNYSLDAGSTYETNYSDWLFISEAQRDAYQAYTEAFAQANAYVDYALTDELYVQLMAALSAKVNYSNSQASTTALLQVVEDIKAYYASFDAVTDCTGYIRNPSFEYKTSSSLLGATESGTNYQVYGWTVSGSGQAEEAFAAWENPDNANGRYFTGMDGNHLFNTWSWGGQGTFFCKQDVTIDEDGYYELSAVVASGGGEEGDTSVDLVFGNVRQNSGILTDRTHGVEVKVTAYCKASSTYTIGLESSKWFKADSFQLKKQGTEAGVVGDVNRDGKVNISDVTALVNIILGRKASIPEADVNNDGTVNISDVTALVNIILGR